MFILLAITNTIKILVHLYFTIFNMILYSVIAFFQLIILCIKEIYYISNDRLQKSGTKEKKKEKEISTNDENKNDTKTN